MLVGRDLGAHRGLAGEQAVGLGEGEEEALIAGQPADHRRRPAAQRRMIGVERGGEAGDVGDILAEGQLAVEVEAGKAS